MVSTLLFYAAAQTAAAQTNDFTHKFTKGEKLTLAVLLTGSDEGAAFEMAMDLELSPEATAEGKTPVALKVASIKAKFDGGDFPIDAPPDVSLKLDKHGAPNEVYLEGFQSAFYVVLLSRYLPAKPLKVGESFSGEVVMNGGKFTIQGKYSGDEELEGKKYPVITSKGTLTPTDDESGDIESKNYYDPQTGRVVRTEATIYTPDGEFRMTVKLTKA